MGAKLDHGDSQDGLSRLYFETNNPADYEQARYWAELAADQDIASAQTRLGTIYHEGLGVQPDPEAAAAWFLLAARADHPGAQLMIGAAYHLGIGIPKDAIEGAHWLLRSVAQGSELADAYLSRVLRELTEEEIAEATARSRSPLTADGAALENA